MEDENERKRQKAPDGGWGWMVVLGAFLSFFVAFGISSTTTFMYKEWMVYFHSSAAATSLAATTRSTVQYVASPLVSVLCRRYNYRVVAMVGGFFTFLGILLVAFPFWQSVFYAFITYGIITGFGNAMVGSATFICVNEYFDKKKGKAMAIASIGGGLGVIILSPVVALLFERYTYSGAVLIISAIYLNYIVAGALFRPILTRKKSYHKTGNLILHLKPLLYERKTKPSSENIGACYQNDYACKRSQEKHEKYPINKSQSDSCLHKGTTDDIYQEDTHSKPTTLGHRRSLQLESHLKLEDNTCGFVAHVSHSTSCEHTLRSDATVNTHINTTNAQAEDNVNDTVKQRKTSLCCNLGNLFNFKLLKNVQFASFCLMMVGWEICNVTFTTYQAPCGTEKGFTDQQIALQISMQGGTNIAGTFLVGVLFDVSRVREYRKVIFMCMSVLTGVCCCLVPVTDGYISWIFVSNVTYVGIHIVYIHVVTVLSDLIPFEDMTDAIGLMRMSIGVFVPVGPLIAGVLADKTGTYTYGYFVAGSTYVATCLAFALTEGFRKRRNCCNTNNS